MSGTRFLVATVLVVVALTTPTAARGGAPTTPLVRASVDSRERQADALSLEPSLSGNGRFVAFHSGATNLVPGDTNGYGEIFVRDLLAGRTVRASIADDESQGNRFSLTQDISDSGRFVAFGSSASNLVAGDTNNLPDTFVRDLATGHTTRVSVSSNGTQGREGGSSAPSLSGSGRVVAFYSIASNLVRGDTNEVADVFVHDRWSRRTTRVSVDSAGAQADGQSAIYSGPALDRAGRLVAFESEATNLVPGDTNAWQDVFVHDRSTGRTQRVSLSSRGVQGDGESYWPSISADGRFVAFASKAGNLVRGDTNGVWDIFVRDLIAGVTSRVSLSGSGVQGNADSFSPSLSATGRYVAFWSYADSLTPGDSNRVADVFVHDRATGRTRLVSTGVGPGDGDSILPAISDDGHVVAFESAATTLVPGDTNDVPDVFVSGWVSGDR